MKTYPSPQPTPPRTPITSFIPRRRQMREDPYKVAIRESHKISMERGLEERNNLSYQIRIHEEKNRSNSIPSSTEPGFQIESLASELIDRSPTYRELYFDSLWKLL